MLFSKFFCEILSCNSISIFPHFYIMFISIILKFLSNKFHSQFEKIISCRRQLCRC